MSWHPSSAPLTEAGSAKRVDAAAGARAARRVCVCPLGLRNLEMSPQKSQSDFYSAFRFPFSNYRLQHLMPCLVSVLDTFLHPPETPPHPGSSSAGIPSEGLAGPGVPTVVNTNPALNRSSCCPKTPGRHVLTMFLSCCLFSRDCGATGKRKSGEVAFTLNTFIPELKSSETSFIKSFPWGFFPA